MGYLSDRLTGHRARREANQFAKTVQPGETWYSVEDAKQPWGDELYVREWAFGKRSRLTGFPKCGHMDAAGVWLNYGPLVREPSPHLKRLFEKDGELSAPDVKKIADLLSKESSKAIAGAR